MRYSVTNEKKAEFGRAFKEARERSGLTIKELGEITGMNPGVFGCWEDGKTFPTKPSFGKAIRETAGWFSDKDAENLSRIFWGAKRTNKGTGSIEEDADLAQVVQMEMEMPVVSAADFFRLAADLMDQDYKWILDTFESIRDLRWKGLLPDGTIEEFLDKFVEDVMKSYGRKKNEQC